MDKCPKCNLEDKVKIHKKGASCLCDLDNCLGQRCGVSEMVVSYKCTRCNEKFTSEEYKYLF